MSYDVSAFYVTETHLKNRLKTDVKPGGGILSGGNGPGYQTNDTYERVTSIGPSEDLLEVDFEHGQIVRVGNQFGVGRVTKAP